MDHLIKHMKQIQLVHPAALCSQDFFLKHDNVLHSCKCLSIFYPQKSYNPLSLHILSRFISARWVYSVSQVQNEVKKNPLCRCCWDPRSCNWWNKGGPKKGIFGSFSETTTAQQPAYTPMELILNFKKFSLIFKKSVLKLWTALCVIKL
jgi:hypothetical protein